MTHHSTERRYTKGTVELREASGGAPNPVFHGYALRFNKLSQNLGGFVERVDPAAIRKTIADGGDVVARIHHDDRYLLGRVSSGTLRLAPDSDGLAYDVDSPGTTYARDLEALARRGDVRHSSFAFRTIGDAGDDWGLTDQGFPLRTLLEVQLVDVAPVVQPAYLDTSSSVRSLADRLDTDPDEVAEMLRSGNLAKVLKAPATHIDLGADRFVPAHDTKDRAERTAGEVASRLFPSAAEPTTTETSTTTGPDDLHPAAEARARQLELYARRFTTL